MAAGRRRRSAGEDQARPASRTSRSRGPGPVERGQKHYYRVQGPTFLIEFDNTQNDGNHVHSIWRDFKGDFGRDLLREHIKTAHH